MAMGDSRILYAIAESCPIDSLLVNELKKSVDSLLRLNLRRFRVPQQNLAKYSALDIVKQALELLFEFSPSEKNYREAMRTIRVYAEGDNEMLSTIQTSFQLFANAVYNAYAGQRHAESLAPQTLFLQGTGFDPAELQKPFRYVGVKPPDMSPPSVQKTIFLDGDFAPYKAMLEGKISNKMAVNGREEHWVKIIQNNLDPNGKNLLRASSYLISKPTGLRQRLTRPAVGKLTELLGERGIDLQVIAKVADINQALRQ